jgi:hypothetical protein
MSDRLVATVDACCRFRIAMRKMAHITCDRQNQRLICINLFHPDGKDRHRKSWAATARTNRAGLDQPAAAQPDRSLPVGRNEDDRRRTDV